LVNSSLTTDHHIFGPICARTALSVGLIDAASSSS
jgi:hypothetical protein